MTYQHKNLAAGQWIKMSFLEQMANIGSEVGRAINWQIKHNASYGQKALERALELIDLTMESNTNLVRLKEIARLREAILDYFFGTNQFMSTQKSWSGYFSHFAYAARRNR